MKYGKFLSIIAAVTLTLAGLILPASPVMAVGSISTSISSGPVGSSITVSGSGYTPGGTIYIYFDNTAFGPFTADGSSSGSVSASINAPILPRTGSAYQIKIIDISNSANNSVPIFFTITSQIVIGAASASVGDYVTVFGNGFYASSPVTIYFDNAVVGTANTDSTGAFDSASFLVPAAYHGAHAVRCKDVGDYTPPNNLYIVSRLIANPSSGGSGDKVVLSGTGFTAGSAVSFYWDDAVVTGASATSDLNGGFTISDFTIPSGSRGAHNIKAQDVNANSANSTFYSAQKIKTSASSGVSGTPITVTGNGFDPGKSVTLKYNTISVAPGSGPITTDSIGGFSATFTIPAGPTGNFTIEAYDGTNLAQATFNAIADVKIGQVTTAANPGYVGEAVTLTGSGLKPNATVNIYYGTENTGQVGTQNAQQIGNATTDGSGYFSTTIKIPPSAPGNHSVTITDSLTIKSFPFFMEDKPPAAPKLLSPTPDAKQDAQGQFTWGDVSDPSGVTYTLQIALDKDFNSVIIEKKGLANPGYTLGAAEKLNSNNSNSPYYWRVQALDGTGLASGWSAPQTFNVGFVFDLSGWTLYAILGIGGVLLFLLGFLLGRKMAQR